MLSGIYKGVIALSWLGVAVGLPLTMQHVGYYTNSNQLSPIAPMQAQTLPGNTKKPAPGKLDPYKEYKERAYKIGHLDTQKTFTQIRINRSVRQKPMVPVYSKYNAETLAKAIEQKQPVLLVFTANWCGYCKVNEKIFQQKDVQQLLADRKVFVMIVDLSNRTRENMLILRKYSQKTAPTIPLYIAFINQNNMEAKELPISFSHDELLDIIDSNFPAQGENK